jgi:hypothetical protein
MSATPARLKQMKQHSQILVAAGAMLGAALGTSTAATPDACRVHSAATAPTVVELYTSEGCSSCPPADRWLLELKPSPTLVPLAFHVNYWDRLGWADRFATPEGTARQSVLAQAAGRANVYTPQVVVNGQDWPDWARRELPSALRPAPVALTLSREGATVSAEVAAAPRAPLQLAGYWAVVEDGFETRVGAGENAGATLRHDDVVRLYRPVPAWPAASGLRAALTVSRGVPEHPRRVVFVVTDAATMKPLQALSLGC